MLTPLPLTATGRQVSLPALLASREQRQARQREWLTRYGTTLISFTVVTPGPIKDSQLTRQIFNHGLLALNDHLQQSEQAIIAQAAFALPTGPEALFAVNAPAPTIKQLAIRLEQTHRLGRLWDLDVLTPEGKLLSRRNFSRPVRPCLVCTRAATHCARTRAHPYSELLTRMEALLHDVDNAC